jgi:hypothetical protein
MKIRIAVAINEKGEWNACGWNGATDNEKMDIALDIIAGIAKEFFVTAEIEPPKPEEITGTVEEGE